MLIYKIHLWKRTLAGKILKKKRQELRLNIREIAVILKIKTEFLIAIENDSFDKLPVAVYTMGYIRTYAKYLDIDPEPIIEYYTEHLPQPKPSSIIPTAFFPVTFSKKKGLQFLYIIPVFLLVLAAFFIISNISQKQTDKSRSDINNVPIVEPISEKKEHALNIDVDEVTWIYIKFGNSRSEDILFQPGQSKRWKFSGKAVLKIGNAGGIRLNFDGKDLGILGESGQVITINLPESE